MDKRRAKLLTDGDALLPADSHWITDEDRNPHVGKPDVAEASEVRRDHHDKGGSAEHPQRRGASLRHARRMKRLGRKRAGSSPRTSPSRDPATGVFVKKQKAAEPSPPPSDPSQEEE